MNISWGDVDTPDNVPMTEQNHHSTRTQCGEPMHLLEHRDLFALLTGGWATLKQLHHFKDLPHHRR